LSRYFTKNVLAAQELPECFMFSDAADNTRQKIIDQGCKDLLVYMTGFISNEKGKVELFEWIRAAGCLMNENPKFFEKELFSMKVDIEQDVKPIKRLWRLHDDCEFVMLRFFGSVITQFQTLDAPDVSSYLGLMKNVKPIFEIIPEDGSGLVSSKNGLQEKF